MEADNALRALRAAGLLFAVLVTGFVGPSAHGGQRDQRKVDLLIARREVRDPFFWHSVVVMLPPAKTRPYVVGIVINKPTKVSLGRLFPKNLAPERRSDAAFLGGPVDISVPSVIFRSVTPQKQALRLYGNVYLTFDPDLIEDSLKRSQPASAMRLFLGRAQWSPEQLKAEILRGGWYRIRGDGDLIFSSDPHRLWLTLHTKAAPSRYINSRPPNGSREGWWQPPWLRTDLQRRRADLNFSRP